MLMPEKSKQSNKRNAPDFSPGQHIIAICLFLVQAMVMFFLGVLVGKYQPSSFYHLKEEAAPVAAAAGTAQPTPPQRHVYEVPVPQKPAETPVKVVPQESQPADPAPAAAPVAPPAQTPPPAAGTQSPAAPAPAAAPGAAAPLPAGVTTSPVVVVPPDKAAAAAQDKAAAPQDTAAAPQAPPAAPEQAAPAQTPPPSAGPNAAVKPASPAPPEKPSEPVAKASAPAIDEEAPLLEGVEPGGKKAAEVKKEPAAATTATTTPAGGKFVIQVASLAGADRKKAETQLHKLEKQTGLKGAVLQASGDKYLRIVVGDFADRASAMKKCDELRKQPEFSGCFVKQR